MSINFGQFPTPRLPLIPTDVVVGYQVVTGVPTLAQYTLLQLAGALGPIIGGLPPTGPAGGDLSGTYPNPTVSAVHATSGSLSGVSYTSGAITGSTIATTTLAATVTGVTGVRVDNSTQVATDNFVNQQIASSTANVPFPLAGGVYNQASLGTGVSFVIFASGGVISSVLTVVNGGSGYAVGDLLLVIGGNYDAVLRVTNVVGGVIQSGGLSVIYGGTAYTTGITTSAVPVPPGQRTVTFTGALTSNVTFIIQNGTFLTAARRIQFNNNTTGAFTVTVKLSNGAGGSVGTGVVLAQGTNNSTATLVETDGVNDVWLADTPLGIGALSSTNPVVLSGTFTPTQLGGIVGTTTNNNANAGSVGEHVTATGTGVSVTSATPTNITSISLTAGDWEVSGVCDFIAGAGTVMTSIIAGANNVSATLAAAPFNSVLQLTFPAALAQVLPVPSQRFSLAGTTTIFLVAQSTFTGGTLTATAMVRARRVR